MILRLQRDGFNFGSKWVDDLQDFADYSGKSWGFEAIHTLDAWDLLTSSDPHPVRIGLIDNGFDSNHEDLDFEECLHNSTPADHGTHVAGIMAARTDNSEGICGIYPYGNLYAISTNSTNNDLLETQNIRASSMCYKIVCAELILRNVKVINCSQGFNYYKLTKAYGKYGLLYTDPDFEEWTEVVDIESRILGDFLNRLLEKGYDFVIVNAAGNDSRRKDDYIFPATYNWWFTAISRDLYPDVYNRIIVVGGVQRKITFLGSTNNCFEIYERSNGGYRVDIYAPGKGIYSLTSNNKYKKKSGTSMAAPHVSGVAALVWTANNSLSGAQIKSIICSSINDNCTACNMIDASKAVTTALATTGQGNSITAEKGGILSYVVDIDDENKKIENASIEVMNQETGEIVETAYTDSNGHFEIIIPEGIYTLTVSANGYLPNTVNNVHVKNEGIKYLDSWIKLTSIYKNFIDSEFDHNIDGLSNLEYTITDVNDDDIPELIIKGIDSFYKSYAYCFYSYENAKVKYLARFHCDGNNSADYPQLYYSDQYNGIVIPSANLYEVLSVNEGKYIICYSKMQDSSGNASYRTYEGEIEYSDLNRDISENDWNQFVNGLKEISFTPLSNSKEIHDQKVYDYIEGDWQINGGGASSNGTRYYSIKNGVLQIIDKNTGETKETPILYAEIDKLNRKAVIVDEGFNGTGNGYRRFLFDISEGYPTYGDCGDYRGNDIEADLFDSYAFGRWSYSGGSSINRDVSILRFDQKSCSVEVNDTITILATYYGNDVPTASNVSISTDSAEEYISSSQVSVTGPFEDNENYDTYDLSFTVSGIKKGNVILTLSIDGSIVDTCNIEVTDNTTNNEKIQLFFDSESYSASIGETTTINATYNGDVAPTASNITASTDSDEELFSNSPVSILGPFSTDYGDNTYYISFIITGKKPGSTVLHLSVDNAISDSCQIEIKDTDNKYLGTKYLGTLQKVDTSENTAIIDGTIWKVDKDTGSSLYKVLKNNDIKDKRVVFTANSSSKILDIHTLNEVLYPSIEISKESLTFENGTCGKEELSYKITIKLLCSDFAYADILEGTSIEGFQIIESINENEPYLYYGQILWHKNDERHTHYKDKLTYYNPDNIDNSAKENYTYSVDMTANINSEMKPSANQKDCILANVMVKLDGLEGLEGSYNNEDLKVSLTNKSVINKTDALKSLKNLIQGAEIVVDFTYLQTQLNLDTSTTKAMEYIIKLRTAEAVAAYQATSEDWCVRFAKKISEELSDKIIDALDISSKSIVPFALLPSNTEKDLDTTFECTDKNGKKLKIYLRVPITFYNIGGSENTYAGLSSDIEYSLDGKKFEIAYGIITYTNMNTFADCVLEYIKAAYDISWGEDADEIAEYFLEDESSNLVEDCLETVRNDGIETLINVEIPDSFSDAIWEITTNAVTKSNS